MGASPPGGGGASKVLSTRGWMIDVPSLLIYFSEKWLLEGGRTWIYILSIVGKKKTFFVEIYGIFLISKSEWHAIVCPSIDQSIDQSFSWSHSRTWKRWGGMRLEETPQGYNWWTMCWFACGDTLSYPACTLLSHWCIWALIQWILPVSSSESSSLLLGGFTPAAAAAACPRWMANKAPCHQIPVLAASVRQKYMNQCHTEPCHTENWSETSCSCCCGGGVVGSSFSGMDSSTGM